MKKTLSTLALSALLVSFDQTPPVSNDETKEPTQKEEQSTSPDWQITLKVKEAILSDSSLSPGNRFVSVSTTDGVVTLTGKVSDQYQINEIVKKAEGIAGVKSVVNKMTVSTS